MVQYCIGLAVARITVIAIIAKVTELTQTNVENLLLIGVNLKKILYEIRYCGKFLCFVTARNKVEAFMKAKDLYGYDKLMVVAV